MKQLEKIISIKGNTENYFTLDELIVEASTLFKTIQGNAFIQTFH